jgi:DNA repair exonuclease SbcCD ATPase subunit
MWYLQTPVPDIPPIPPIPDFSQVIVGPEVVPAWVPYVAALGIIMFGIIMFPIVRALARRIEGKTSNEAELRGEIEALHQRVADLEAVEQRMSELENRIEFSERLLTQHREGAALERGGRA